MSPVPPSPPPAPAAPSFKHWLRRELRRELQLAALFLIVALALVLLAERVFTGFDARWSRLNHQLAQTALDQHPTALLDTFAARLADTEYGWRVLAWSAPFNVTAAREQLQADFPEFIGIGPDGQPLAVRASHLVRPVPGQRETRAAAFLARHQHIESGRFNRLYRDAAPFDEPRATDRLARLITKLIGLPDALLHLLHRIVQGGVAGILLFSGTLALSAVALRSSARPARRWLKILLCPFLASCLIWVAIGFMSLGAALCGGFTPNTAALAVLGGAPLLYLAAKAPLRLLEDLQLKPKPWDGVERRRNPRPPLPPAPPAPPTPSAGA